MSRPQLLREPCEHRYVFQGLVYWHEDDPMPGSSAHARRYGDKYFCERCLTTRIENEREIGTSYVKPLPGAMPR